MATQVLSTRLFPLLLAVLQVVRFGCVLAFDYRETETAEKSFDAWEYIRQDLARPFFEPSAFCGAYSHYSTATSLNISADLPALTIAAVIRQDCTGGVQTPRGQILWGLLVGPQWFLVGCSLRRLSKGRWRAEASGRVRAFWLIGLLAAPVGILFLLGGVLVASVDFGTTLRVAGIGSWLLFGSALAAERLRMWPFRRLAAA